MVRSQSGKQSFVSAFELCGCFISYAVIGATSELSLCRLSIFWYRLVRRLARSKNGNGKEREALCDCAKVGAGSKDRLAPVDCRFF